MLSSFILPRRCAFLTSQHATALACDIPISNPSQLLKKKKKRKAFGAPGWLAQSVETAILDLGS